METNWLKDMNSSNYSTDLYSYPTTQDLQDLKNISGIDEDCQVLKFLPWNNPDNLISFQTKLLLIRIFGAVVIPLVSLLGIPVNVLNCVVFFKHGLRERINLLLFCLACSDFVVSAFLFMSTVEYMYTQLLGLFTINGPLVTFMTNYVSIVYGSVYVSGFISTLISFERCLCVTYPLIAKQVLKTKTMGTIVAISSVILITFVYFASGQKYRIVCGYYPALKLKLAVHYPNDFYLQNKTLMDILSGFVYGVCLPGFFSFTSIITTVITTIKLTGAASWRQQTSSLTLESKEVALTKMLIVVTCLFIACTVPSVVMRIGPVAVDEFRLGGRHQNLLLSGILLIYLSNAVNSTFNFVFYYKMGSRFRVVLKGLCYRGRNDSEPKQLVVTKPVDVN